MSTPRLLSAQVVMPVIVQYSPSEEVGELTAVGYVSYGQDRVYFPNNPEFGEEMERAVLASLDSTAMFQQPVLPEGFMAEVENLRASSASKWGVEDFHG